MTEKEKNTNWLVQESLIYERAYSRICRIIDDLQEEKNADIKTAKENGEETDGSFKVLLEMLTDLRKKLRDQSDELWIKAERSTDRYDSGYENLFNAIVVRAAQDYEEALCGMTNERSIDMIEKFLPKRFTNPIRKAQPEFAKVVKEHGKEILDETKQKRRELKRHNRGDMRDNSIKCPLCGCGLYAWGSNQNGLQKIKCTGCSLFDFAYIKEDEDES